MPFYLNVRSFIAEPSSEGFNLNQYQGGMCISGVLKTTERTPRRLISPCRSQMGGHRQCGPAICTFHPGFSLESVDIQVNPQPPEDPGCLI